jgi:hypothetical protein
LTVLREVSLPLPYIFVLLISAAFSLISFHSYLLSSDMERPVLHCHLLSSDMERPILHSYLLSSDMERPVLHSYLLSSDIERPVLHSYLLSSDIERPVLHCHLLSSDIGRPVLLSVSQEWQHKLPVVTPFLYILNYTQHMRSDHLILGVRCWVRQTRLPKHFCACSNLRLH